MPNFIKNAVHDIDAKIRLINSSKIFAGLVVVVLNISSKYVNIGLSKSMETYLKHSFSRNIMVGAILWMGTRDIYTAFLLTCIFILFADFILNDDSSFCMIPEHIKQRQEQMSNKPTEDEIKKAQEVLRRAGTSPGSSSGSADSFLTKKKKRANEDKGANEDTKKKKWEPIKSNMATMTAAGF